MTEMKINEVAGFIDREITELEQSKQTLMTESREDEAILCKVRINICEIYRNMLYAILKKVDKGRQLAAQERTQLFCRDYLELMHKITGTWCEGLQAAKKANDYRGILVEEIKLETAKQLEEQFQKVFGDVL